MFEFWRHIIEFVSYIFEFWRQIFEFWRQIFEFWHQKLKIESFRMVMGGGGVGPPRPPGGLGIGVGNKYFEHPLVKGWTFYSYKAGGFW